jgi:hypothetical protein
MAGELLTNDLSEEKAEKNLLFISGVSKRVWQLPRITFSRRSTVTKSVLLSSGQGFLNIILTN